MRNLFVFLFAFSFSTMHAQVDTTNLKVLTQEFVDAFIAKDFGKMANMTHPNMIKMSGNLEFVKSDYEADYKILESMGFRFINGTIGSPGEIFQSGAEYLCFIPQVFTVELKGLKYLSFKPILATTMTNGKVWNFVTLDRQDQASISTFVPSYEDRMGWPEIKPMEEISN